MLKRTNSWDQFNLAKTLSAPMTTFATSPSTPIADVITGRPGRSNSEDDLDLVTFGEPALITTKTPPRKSLLSAIFRPTDTSHPAETVSSLNLSSN